jgi:hypothetical protein
MRGHRARLGHQALIADRSGRFDHRTSPRVNVNSALSLTSRRFSSVLNGRTGICLGACLRGCASGISIESIPSSGTRQFTLVTTWSLFVLDRKDDLLDEYSSRFSFLPFGEGRSALYEVGLALEPCACNPTSRLSVVSLASVFPSLGRLIRAIVGQGHDSGRHRHQAGKPCAYRFKVASVHYRRWR